MSGEAIALPVRARGWLVRRPADRSRLRSAAVVLPLPALVVTAYYIGASWAVAPFSNRPYSPALATEANSSIVVIGPYLALAAAWEMGALRAVYGRLVIRRSWLRVAVGRLSLVVGCGVASMALVYVVVGGPTFLSHPPVAGLVLVSACGVLAWTSLGAALGLVLRPFVALPLALLTRFLALSLPQGWQTLWIRHVNGYISDCCSPGEVLDHRAVQASVAFLLALLVCSGAAIAVRLAPTVRDARRAAGLGALTALVSVAAALVAIAPVVRLGAVPTLPRSTASLRRTDQVCLWPEDTPARAANAAAWRSVQGTWARLRLPLPVTRIAPVALPGALGLATSSMDEQAATVSISTALPRQLSGCGDDYSDQARDQALDRLGYLVLSLSAPQAATQAARPDGPLPAAADAPALWAASQGCR